MGIRDGDAYRLFCMGNVAQLFHCPFYCYSYIFGNLLSIILFQTYREKGNGFLEAIRAGSSLAPMEMFTEMGLNPEDKSFWKLAFQYMEDLIDSWEGC